MKYQEQGSILLIHLLFLSIFSIYIGIIVRQASYYHDQLELQYQQQKKEYMTETVLWWAVALCIDQFEMLQTIIKQKGVCIVPTDVFKPLFETMKEKNSTATVTISSIDHNNLRCDVVCDYSRRGMRASCICRRISDIGNDEQYSISNWDKGLYGEPK